MSAPVAVPASPDAPLVAYTSRAFNVDASFDQVIAMAAKHDATISAIERLDPSGTRVVFQNGDGAAAVSRAFGNKVIKGAVKRLAWSQQRLS